MSYFCNLKKEMLSRGGGRIMITKPFWNTKNKKPQWFPTLLEVKAEDITTAYKVPLLPFRFLLLLLIPLFTVLQPNGYLAILQIQQRVFALAVSSVPNAPTLPIFTRLTSWPLCSNVTFSEKVTSYHDYPSKM